MDKRKEIDLHHWYRKDHFDFFSQFSEPFFGLTTSIDCTQAYRFAKERQFSFFLTYLHASLVAANKIAPFRYRIEDGKLYEYDVVHASPTINRENGSFGFSYLEYRPDFETFKSLAIPKIDEVRASNGLVPAVSGENVIHYSSIPWIDFTAVSHARHFDFPDSCPKITFGKMTSKDDKQFLAVSIHVHHAVMDGYHVGQFVEAFQELMNASY